VLVTPALMRNGRGGDGALPRPPAVERLWDALARVSDLPQDIRSPRPRMPNCDDLVRLF